MQLVKAVSFGYGKDDNSLEYAMLSPVDEIKTRLDIVDFIGTYVQLKRAGANFKARCPFHQEKTASFMVSKPKQIWHCFGCNEGGDIFKFLMKIEGLDFPEALKLLADKAGIVLPRYDARAQSQRNTLMEIMKEAMEFYSKELQGSRGKLALEYLKRRGLSDSVISQFNLGYAPDSWDALTTQLRDKYKAEEVFSAGLTIRSERNQGFYDRFRHRVMFPIRDVHGNAIGFTSRLLDESRAEGKYINTPETLIYNKSRVLYGLDLARQKIRDLDYAILVEGNMDVIACHQFGMANVVAASGTALTLDQIRLLKRYTNNLMVSFDADVAGENAAKRGIDAALSEGMRVKVITLPAGYGKDPDECLRKDIKVWEKSVRGAKEIMDYYIDKAQINFDIGTAHGRSQFVHGLLSEIKKLSDAVEQDFWIKRISELAKVDEKLLRSQMGSGLAKAAADTPLKGGYENLSTQPARPRAELISQRILSLFMVAPTYSEEIISSVLPEMLSPKAHQDLYVKLVECYTTYNSIRHSNAGPSTSVGGADFRQFWHDWASKMAQEVLSTADILELYGDKEFEGWSDHEFKREVVFICDELRREYVRVRRQAIASDMRAAEKEGNYARVKELTREFTELSE